MKCTEEAKFNMIYISTLAVGYIFIIMLSIYVVEYGSAEKHDWYVRLLTSIAIVIPIYIPSMVYFLYKGYIPSTATLYRWFLGLSVTTSWIICLYLLSYFLNPEGNAFENKSGFLAVSIIAFLIVFILRFTKLSKP